MNVLSGGVKMHMMKYKGFVVNNDKKVVIQITATGKSNKSCGGRYSGALNFKEFSEYKKFNVNGMCKNCLYKFNELVTQRDNLKAIK